MRCENSPPQAPPRLTEKDLEPGRAWTHPESCLEYADFHAFLLGDPPLYHWRNEKVKELEKLRRDNQGRRYVHPVHGTGNLSADEYCRVSVERYITCYTRDGYPLAIRALTAGEHLAIARERC